MASAGARQRHVVSNQVIKEMRAWVRDCEWGDLDPDGDVIDALTQTEIIRGVELHYDGGVDGFIADTAAVSPIGAALIEALYESDQG